MKAPMLLALAGLSISTAQAADHVLTLACQGTTTDTTFEQSYRGIDRFGHFAD